MPFEASHLVSFWGDLYNNKGGAHYKYTKFAHQIDMYIVVKTKTKPMEAPCLDASISKIDATTSWNNQPRL